MVEDTGTQGQQNEYGTDASGYTITPPPEEPGIPLLSGLSRLLRSSKAIVVVAAIVTLAVLTYFGKVTSEVTVETIKWLVIAFIGAVAVEDGAIKLTQRSGTSTTLAAWVMQQIMPFISGLLSSLGKQSNPNTASVPRWTPEMEATLREAEELFKKNQAEAAAAQASPPEPEKPSVPRPAAGKKE